MKVISLASVLALAFLSGACEKQSYSETRAFTHHGSHGGEPGDHKKTASDPGSAPAAQEKPGAATPPAQ